MGLFDWLKPNTGYSGPPDPSEMVIPIIDAYKADILRMPESEIWRTQPYLRMVINFIARNVAQVGLHTLARVDAGGRERVRDSPAAQLLAAPSADQTTYELILDLVSTLMLWDEAILWLHSDAATGRRQLRVIKPSWIVGYRDRTPFTRGKVIFRLPNSTDQIVAMEEELIAFHGWDPIHADTGDPPVTTLRTILAEQFEAQSYRLSMWNKGGRVGTYLTRPTDAKWSPEARGRFTREFRSQYTGRGSGGVPLLEDGMEMKKIGVSAKEEDFVDASKLSLTTVASVYHINPTMLGLLDSANYSNVKEFRRMLYGDSLGPIIKQLEDRFNAFLLPKLGEPDGHYVEFNLREKLRGSFEEQGALYRSGVGGPWLTVNEARERENLPTVEGGDELLRPLNVGTSIDGSDGSGTPAPGEGDES